MYLKLCKYEFKSIARTLLPIYLAVVVVSLINALSFGVNDLFHAGSMVTGYGAAIQQSHAANTLMELMQLVVFLAYFGVMVALFVLTLIVIIQRFYKGLLCDEGYLMFTLPVKPWQLIASKGTAAFGMSVISGAAAFLSILILMCGVGGPVEFFSSIFDPRIWWRMFGDLNEVFPKWGLYVLLYCFEFLILAIVSGMAGLFQMYVAMALGHLAQRRRILMSVAAYLVISMALSFLSGAGMMLLDGSGIMHALTLMLGNSAHTGIQLMILGLLAWNILQLAAFFFGTERILSKKLNLE